MRTLLLALMTALPLLAQPAVLRERARPEAVNAMLKGRLDHLLPALMRETGSSPRRSRRRSSRRE